MSSLDPSSASTALKMLWIAFQITPSAEATAKISIAVSLMRITTSKRWKLFLSALIVLTIMITICTLFSILMSCWPIQLLRDLDPPGHCNTLERTVAIYFQGGRNLRHGADRHQINNIFHSHGCRLRFHSCNFAHNYVSECSDESSFKLPIMWPPFSWAHVRLLFVLSES